MYKETVCMADKEIVMNTEHEETTDILQRVTRNTEESSQVSGIVIGKLSGFDADGTPFVEFSVNPTGRAIPSRSTVELNENHIGRNVALMFELSNVRKPIIIGMMHVPGNHAAVEVTREEEIVRITAETEIHICCGESSIRMNKNGKIEIKGRDILSQAIRGNKIRGGMVGLN
jgi:hypothetical protein